MMWFPPLTIVFHVTYVLSAIYWTLYLDPLCLKWTLLKLFNISLQQLYNASHQPEWQLNLFMVHLVPANDPSPDITDLLSSLVC